MEDGGGTAGWGEGGREEGDKRGGRGWRREVDKKLVEGEGQGWWREGTVTRSVKEERGG